MSTLFRKRRTFRPGLERLEDRFPVTTVLGAPIMTAWPEALSAEESTTPNVATNEEFTSNESDISPGTRRTSSSLRDLRAPLTTESTTRLNSATESVYTATSGADNSSYPTDTITTGLLPELSSLANLTANVPRLDLPHMTPLASANFGGSGGGGGGGGSGGGGGGSSSNAPNSSGSVFSGATDSGANSAALSAAAATQISASVPSSATAGDQTPHFVPEFNAGGKGGGSGGNTSTNFEYFVTGNSADLPVASLPATSGGLALAGGGTDVDALFTWMAGKAGGGDFLVIRATGTDAYNPYIYSDLGLSAALDSVATLVIKNSAGANDPFVVQKVSEAEAIFIAGGDQSDYIKYWKGTALESAINTAVESKHVPIGGTSAGLAVLGDFDYAALKGSVTSTEALKNPYDSRVTIDTGFITPVEAPTSVLKYLDNVITDSHFLQRDRMGREMTFMARVDKNYLPAGEVPRGIAINEQTALLVEADGSAMVIGNPTSDPVAAARSVYFLQGPTSSTSPTILSAKGKLTYTVHVARVDAGTTLSIATWPTAGWDNIAVNGVVTSTKAGGSIY